MHGRRALAPTNASKSIATRSTGYLRRRRRPPLRILIGAGVTLPAREWPQVALRTTFGRSAFARLWRPHGKRRRTQTTAPTAATTTQQPPEIIIGTIPSESYLSFDCSSTMAKFGLSAAGSKAAATVTLQQRLRSAARYRSAHSFLLAQASERDGARARQSQASAQSVRWSKSKH